MKVDVYYWKDPGYLIGDPPKDRPTFLKDYVRVATLFSDATDCQAAAEEIFHRMNRETSILTSKGAQEWLRTVLGDSAHTSMSVGDIASVEDNLFCCRPCGWEELKFGAV